MDLIEAVKVELERDDRITFIPISAQMVEYLAEQRGPVAITCERRDDGLATLIVRELDE